MRVRRRLARSRCAGAVAVAEPAGGKEGRRAARPGPGVGPSPRSGRSTAGAAPEHGLQPASSSACRGMPTASRPVA